MKQPVKILVVGEEMINEANISMQLCEMSHEVPGIIPGGKDTLSHIQNNLPDTALIDIQFKVSLNLTANGDDANFNRAKGPHPYAFIFKPYKKLDLQRNFELSISQLQNNSHPTSHDLQNR
ncbi:hypothetical protein FHG64_06505 [Antarcticibacterium flavum]|uniref:Response regulator n=1 Tax=Antarcticibacterium flavum TaxID=2058175 RepID=A0A5B7X0P5_9FLAO|nr:MULTISPECIES: hypothetical protein [Antarcticibacterium]MCM4161303.1 hypothetical protein [Antarcticibacterium sp. W02-3]QCY69086.1 hypothetical protein FHG64_06505 [Antarcticibacterium flavum]